MSSYNFGMFEQESQCLKQKKVHQSRDIARYEEAFASPAWKPFIVMQLQITVPFLRPK